MLVEIRKPTVNVPPGRKFGYIWGCEGVQVVGCSGERSGSLCYSEQKGCGTYVGGEVENAKVPVAQWEM
jgi:hypothetical protein